MKSNKENWQPLVFANAINDYAVLHVRKDINFIPRVLLFHKFDFVCL